MPYDNDYYEIGDNDEPVIEKIKRGVGIKKTYKEGKLYPLSSIPKKPGKVPRRGIGPIRGQAEYE
jgi:hypothetical protein